ncbi:hypothetical protein AURDEDRAFT_114098 [Auricularia subglabra TFB-10046 SS5]|nr:hypothetical protein AURDEDRAFT_114098 [Auricularia subglabra TFB-10046 SS5]
MSPTENDARLSIYLILVPITVFFYDWVLTLGDEIEFVWRRDWSSKEALFVALRYGAVALLCIKMREVAHGGLSEQVGSCKVQGLIGDIGMIVIMILVQVVLQLRIYLMYHRSKALLWINAMLTVIEVGLTLFIYFQMAPRIQRLPSPETGAGSCVSHEIDPRGFAYCFIYPMLFECYLAALAVYKSWQTRRGLPDFGADDLLSILIRDSIIYFVLVASVMAVATILFLTAPRLAAMNDAILESISAIGGTRLILSARQALLSPDSTAVNGTFQSLTMQFRTIGLMINHRSTAVETALTDSVEMRTLADRNRSAGIP